jgi:ribosomal protein S11
LGAALFGGLGFAAGRASRRPAAADTAASAVPQAAEPDMTVRLKELADMHASGSLTDEEFAAAKAKLLGS